MGRMEQGGFPRTKRLVAKDQRDAPRRTFFSQIVVILLETGAIGELARILLPRS